MASEIKYLEAIHSMCLQICEKLGIDTATDPFVQKSSVEGQARLYYADLRAGRNSGAGYVQAADEEGEGEGESESESEEDGEAETETETETGQAPKPARAARPRDARGRLISQKESKE